MFLIIKRYLLLFFRNTAFQSQIQAKNGPNFQEKAIYILLPYIQAPAWSFAL